MKLHETALVEHALALRKRRVMCFPSVLGVAIRHAGNVKDCLPELAHRLVGRRVRKDLPRPRNNRHAGDAPGVLAKVQATAVIRALPVRGQHARGGLGGVYTEHGVGICPVKPQERGAGAGKRVHLLHLPGGELTEPLDRAVLVLEARQLVVRPDERDMAGTRLVGRRNHHAHERRRLDGRRNHKLLTALNGHAPSHDKLGVLLEPWLKLPHRKGALGLAHGYLGHRSSRFVQSTMMLLPEPRHP